MKPYVRYYKLCREPFIIPLGRTSIECPFCHAHYTIEWVPKLHIDKERMK